MHEVMVGRDFSRTPGGRYRRHGPGNGEDFRNKHLLPYLQRGETVVVKLDDTAGYPPSFLEEAFGGLLRSGVAMTQLSSLLRIEAIIPANEIYCQEAWQFINEEAARSQHVARSQH